MTYIGRFAPSPTGVLHAGSLVAALASWLDARAHGGQWLVRMEDVDTPRCVPGADAAILAQLQECGLIPDQPVTWQSQRHALYQRALDALMGSHLAYPCACTRADIALAQTQAGQRRERNHPWVYPGTCRPERGGLAGKPARAWRMRVPEPEVAWWDWSDRRLGAQRQNLAQEVGDFIVRRADGLWAYQLAVVVDDAEQGITHVVRGEDLADNTPRQQWLQRSLGLPTPAYLHTPLVLGPNGEKLSKQNGARAIDTTRPLAALNAAAKTLELPHMDAATVSDWLVQAVRAWPWRAPARPSVGR